MSRTPSHFYLSHRAEASGKEAEAAVQMNAEEEEGTALSV